MHQGQGAAGRDSHPGAGHTAPPLLWSLMHEVRHPSSRVGRGASSYSASSVTGAASLLGCRPRPQHGPNCLSGLRALCPCCRRKQAGISLRVGRGAASHAPRGVMLDHAVAGRTWGPRAPSRRQWGQSGRRVVWRSTRPHSPGTGAQRLHPCHMTGRPPGLSPGSLGPGSAWSCPRRVFRGACATPSPGPRAQPVLLAPLWASVCSGPGGLRGSKGWQGLPSPWL